MTREDIIKTINTFLIEELEIDENLIQEDALLKEKLGIDSLDFVDIVVIVKISVEYFHRVFLPS